MKWGYFVTRGMKWVNQGQAYCHRKKKNIVSLPLLYNYAARVWTPLHNYENKMNVHDFHILPLDNDAWGKYTIMTYNDVCSTFSRFDFVYIRCRELGCIGCSVVEPCTSHVVSGPVLGAISWLALENIKRGLWFWKGGRGKSLVFLVAALAGTAGLVRWKKARLSFWLQQLRPSTSLPLRPPQTNQ